MTQKHEYNQADMPLYDDLMLRHACGHLEGSLSALVAAHACLSRDAARKMRSLEALGGAMLAEDCAPVAMSDNSLQSLLGQLDCEETALKCQPRQIDTEYMADLPLPPSLRDFIAQNRRRPARWLPIAPGLKIMSVMLAEERRRLTLLKARPGAQAPHHEHEGLEITLLLQGAMIDGGNRYIAGDLICMEAHTDHHPVADPELGCICAVVTDSDPKSLLGKLGASLLSALT